MKALKTLLLLITSFLSYSQDILSPKNFLGFTLEERFSYHHEIENYCDYIVSSHPEIFRRINYGITPEGRSLFVIAAAGKDDLPHLDSIRKKHLASTGLSGLNKSMEDQLILWLSFNIHGDEASGSETALRVLQYLSQNTIPDDLIILIDPNQNPDGRERYIQWFGQVNRKEQRFDSNDIGYHQQWPHGRFSHFLSDLNRDWLWQVQPESKQRMKLYHQWMPHVHVDFHEMEPEKTYFFPPSADPVHELVTLEQQNTILHINSFLQRLFKSKSWDSYSRDEFDLLYPSYADSYAMFNGGIGLTMEQGGSDQAGMFYINSKSDTLTLKSRVTRHLAVAKTLIKGLPEIKSQILENYNHYYQFENVKTPFSQFLIKNKDRSRIKGLTDFLDLINISYSFAQAGSEVVSGLNFTSKKEDHFLVEEGDLIISCDQPKKRLIQILFEPHTKMGDHKTYDISSWSLPYLYHLEAFALREAIVFQPTSEKVLDFSPGSDLLRICYQSSYSAELLAHVLQSPAEVYFQRQEENTYLLLKKGECENEDWARIIAKINSLRLDAEPATRNDWKKAQNEDAPALSLPKIGIAYGEGTKESSLGDLITLFENNWDIPYSRIQTELLPFLKIENYDVLIFPHGTYRNFDLDTDRMKRWLANGGKMILIEGGLDINTLLDIGIPRKKNLDEILYSKEKNEPKNLIQGAFFKVDLHPESILSSGFSSPAFLMIEDLPRHEVRIPDKNFSGVLNSQNHLGGYVGVNAAQYLGNSYILGTYYFGNGGIHQFTVNPLFRGLLEDGKLLFANALFLPLK